MIKFVQCPDVYRCTKYNAVGCESCTAYKSYLIGVDVGMSKCPYCALKDGREENKPNWVPIKYRPLTEVERVHFSEYWGVEYCDTLSEQAFDCPMPEPDQEILITTKWGVEEDVCLYDPDEGYSLEENGDWDGVIAWMPKPEPYKVTIGGSGAN